MKLIADPRLVPTHENDTLTRIILKEWAALKRFMPAADTSMYISRATHFEPASHSSSDINARPASLVGSQEYWLDTTNSPDDDWPATRLSGGCDEPPTVLPNGLVYLDHESCCLRAYFCRTWKYNPAPDRFAQQGVAGRTPDYVHWEASQHLDRSLAAVPAPTGRLRAYGFEEDEDDVSRSERSRMQRDKETKWFPLRHAISSQLLLYRVIEVFGEPPVWTSIDAGKQTWAIELERKPGPGEETETGCGRLTLQDWKGAAMAEYNGSKRNGAMALQLLEWLVGDNVPGYNGISGV